MNVKKLASECYYTMYAGDRGADKMIPELENLIKEHLKMQKRSYIVELHLQLHITAVSKAKAVKLAEKELNRVLKKRSKFGVIERPIAKEMY